jgi:DNA invertase Pin-like site-specific DNA recombinase
VDVVAVVRLDRLARSTHHLLTLGRELEALGVDLVATVSRSGRVVRKTPK